MGLVRRGVLFEMRTFWSQGRGRVVYRSRVIAWWTVLILESRTREEYPPHPRRASMPDPSAGNRAVGSPPEDNGPVSWTVLLLPGHRSRGLHPLRGQASPEAPTRSGSGVFRRGAATREGRGVCGTDALGGAGAKPLRLQLE